MIGAAYTHVYIYLRGKERERLRRYIGANLLLLAAAAARRGRFSFTEKKTSLYALLSLSVSHQAAARVQKKRGTRQRNGNCTVAPPPYL